MSYHDYQYIALVNRILENGYQSDDRTNTGTVKVPGERMEFDISDFSIPLLTIKKINTHPLLIELGWFLDGECNITRLKDNNVKIWNPWATKDGYLGPVYGKIWRESPPVYDVVPIKRKRVPTDIHEITEEKIKQLASQVDKLVAWLEQVRKENEQFRSENTELKQEIQQLRNEVFSLKQDKADRSQVVKTKLTSILDRLDELEQIG